MLVNKLINWSIARTEQYGAQYRIFGIFGIINYPLAYLYEIYIENNFNTGYSWLRLLIGVLCLFLTAKDYWSVKYQRLLPIFYYITLTISIPIFSCLMLLTNQLSLEWLMNFNIGIMVLVLLLDSLTFLIIEIIGISIGVGLFYLSGGQISNMPVAADWNLFLYMFICITTMGTLFSRSNEKFHDFSKKIKDDLNAKLEKLVQKRTYDLEKALAAKKEFLNNMSHEIRTPIQGIVGISQGLIDHWDQESDSQKKLLATKVAQNGQRLVLLVSNLLDLSRFSANKMILSFAEADLKILIQDIIKECNDLYINDKKIKLQFITDLSVAPLNCDADRITQLLRNLFANSIKFTTQGIITAQLTQINSIEDQQINYHFSLIDCGIGIPLGEEEQIFEPFIQSSRTKTKAGGTGLGLAICQQIIKAHNGSIMATNKPTGGSIFEFFIPQNQLINQNQLVTELSEYSVTNQIESNDVNSQAKTILFIDDEEAAHFSMKMMLHYTNYKLILAEGGIEGLAKLQAHKDEIDLVLLDLMMPDMYGLNVLAIIREDLALRDIKVILQTGSSDENELERAKELGVIDIISKPYNKNKIHSTLAKFLGDDVTQRRLS